MVEMDEAGHLPHRMTRLHTPFFAETASFAPKRQFRPGRKQTSAGIASYPASKV